MAKTKTKQPEEETTTEFDLSKVKVKDEPEESEEMTYTDKLRFVNKIAHPMASKKLSKKIYKLIKKASKHKTYIRNGLRAIQTRVRKGETGIMIFAGDVHPIDIMCHLPAVCEQKGIPYIYTPSRQDIGTAMGVRRGSIGVLIKEHPDYKDAFETLAEEIKHIPQPCAEI